MSGPGGAMNQSVKEFLESARCARLKANDWKEELAMIESDISGLRSAGVGGLGVQNNTRRDLSDTLILFERKREKAIAEIRAMAELQEQAEGLIHSIRYGPWERLFFRRYILGETWEKAADETYFSQRGAMLAAGKVYKQLEASEEWKRIQENRLEA